MAKTVDELAERWLSDATTLQDIERRVLESAIKRKPLSKNRTVDYQAEGGAGGRLADALARVGGSWSFIAGFILLLLLWTIGNAWLLGRETFDPYPFVFLNLVLSMLAAIQAPIIMMSQNRQAARDRIDAVHDYEVNLKAEIEIMALHEKMDALRHSEIVAVHRQIVALTERLGAVEQLLKAPKPDA